MGPLKIFSKKIKNLHTVFAQANVEVIFYYQTLLLVICSFLQIKAKYFSITRLMLIISLCLSCHL